MSEVTFSISIKKGEPNYGSSGIEIHNIPLGTDDLEIQMLAARAWDAQQLAKDLADPDSRKMLYQLTATRIIQEAEFTKEERKAFQSVCKEKGKDPVLTIIAGKEEACTSFDDFICYAASGQRPAGAKVRVAK